MTVEKAIEILSEMPKKAKLMVWNGNLGQYVPKLKIKKTKVSRIHILEKAVNEDSKEYVSGWSDNSEFIGNQSDSIETKTIVSIFPIVENLKH